MMLRNPVYCGQDGYKAITEHMKALQFERKQGGNLDGFAVEYFHGMLYGLNLLNAIGADISPALHDFVLKDHGFNVLPDSAKRGGI